MHLFFSIASERKESSFYQGKLGSTLRDDRPLLPHLLAI